MKNQPFVSRSTMRCRCWLDHGSPTTSSSEDAETGSVCREFSSTYASTPSITTVKKKPNRQLSAPTASSNYLPTDGVQYYTVLSGAFRLQSADCYKQTPPTYKHCAVCDAAVPITSDGKIDNNLFGWPNRFESIRSAESIWLIIDSVVTYYYTIHYTIHNLLNSSNKRACSNRFVNVTIVSSK